MIGVSHHPHNWHTGIYLGEPNFPDFPYATIEVS